MLGIKKICLLIFIAILIVFTVGYSSQPIIQSNNTGNTIDNSKLIISLYDGVNPDANALLSTLLSTLLGACIVCTILLACGILLGYIGMKFISKIVFFIVMIFMIAIFITIQIIILSKSILKNIKVDKLTAIPEYSNGNGYYFILASVIVMIVNFLIYAILA
jgi:hypothetical protein